MPLFLICLIFAFTIITVYAILSYDGYMKFDLGFCTEKMIITCFAGCFFGFIICIPVYYFFYKLPNDNLLAKNPNIVYLGDIDGCRINFVNAGRHKMYIAKCGNTTTKTEIIPRGKTTETITTVIKND